MRLYLGIGNEATQSFLSSPSLCERTAFWGGEAKEFLTMTVVDSTSTL